MICKHCGLTVTVDNLKGDEGSISCSNSSACKSCSELANAIAGLELERSKLKRNINRIHSPFIRMLPPEIIARISQSAITDFPGSLPDVLLLSSVCSDWRETVVETPYFWSSIKIELPPLSRTASSTLLRLATFVDEWLSRSGQLPLNISLCCGNQDETLTIPPYYGPSYRDGSETPTDPLTLEQYRPIFKILNQYSSRYHSLNIFIPQTLLPFLQPDSLPLLEHLNIASSVHHPLSVNPYRIDPDHVITFPSTPRLNTVGFRPFPNSRAHMFASPNIGIQWNTVTHVSAVTITAGNCLALLRLAPQLVHCTIHKFVDDGEHRHLEPPIVSQLTYFSLHHQSDRPHRVLDNIKLPSLETLVLFNVTIDPVIAFIERSTCSLHTLSLLNWQIRKTDKLIPLLEFLSPSLKRLSISRLPSPMRGTRNYLSLLIQIYTSQSEVVGNDFLPHLEIFEYREESPSTLESSVLSNLPSRTSAKPNASAAISLRSGYISKATIINKHIPREISPMIRRLEEVGIITYT